MQFLQFKVCTVLNTIVLIMKFFIITFSHLTISSLVCHLRVNHNYSIQSEIIKFQNFTLFLSWKAEEERRTNSAYVQQCAPKTFNEHRNWYFYCNRSGFYRQRSKGVRHTKSQGTSKIGERCRAHMRVTEDIHTGLVSVQYCSTHHNHDINLGHLRLQHDTRMKIAAQLQQGVGMSRIMDNIRGDICGGITREHLVTKQDIHNIKNIYNIEGVMRHTNDLTSVCLWIEEMKGLPYNPVLLYKQQGEEQPNEMDNVGVNDFIIGIQTEFQRDMLIKYGNECVCMDSTHGTNAYDFNLITVLVIDSLGEGISVAWAIANREDVTMIVEFLKCIRDRTGSIKPQWFMSDDANQYYNAWKGVFGAKETTKLLCAWHVDRAWRTAINQHTTYKHSRVEIYHHLQVLLMENNEGKFRQLLQQFISFLDCNEPRFSIYFKENYCNRISEWASHKRSGSLVNTNMFLESFHRTLKVVYLEHKHNRRIDYLLHTLLKISRDKIFEQITKLEKGKFTHRISEINKRHKGALKITSQIHAKDKNMWTIPPPHTRVLATQLRKKKIPVTVN